MSGFSIFDLPVELIGNTFSYLEDRDIPKVELTCQSMQMLVKRYELWKSHYSYKCNVDDWRQPEEEPSNWKQLYHQVGKERGLNAVAKIPDSSTTVNWRVSLPFTADTFSKKSREFVFSSDAVGDPIKWQLEVELERGHAVPAKTDDSVLLINSQDKPQHFRQYGLVRMWTTNNWTAETTRHYYGSHCTISLRDSLSKNDIQPEVPVDIDNSAALDFNTACLSSCRELVIKVNLTLALELAVPLDPFYSLISSENKAESDIVKIGYCKAIFEVARCKRKTGGMFVRSKDRDVRALVKLAKDQSTTQSLRIEVFQALFNLLGPTSILLDDEVVADLLDACFLCLRSIPVIPGYPSRPNDRQTAGLLAQNALGTVFNLLVHPLCVAASTPSNLTGITKLLSDPTYRICHFSVITVLLTILSWGKLPGHMMQPLEHATVSFMIANNPLDSDCTGVAWDESDVAAFFIPLLRTPRLICIKFATWCIAKYYFPTAQIPL